MLNDPLYNGVLENERENLVGNFLAVFVPIYPILFSTSHVVSHGSVCEQDDQKRDIEIGNWAGKEGGAGPKERS